MRILVSVIGMIACAGLLGCGPIVKQGPAEQAIADEAYADIMENSPNYRGEPGIKVLAGCIAWDGQKPVRFSGFSGYYYESRYAARGRSIEELKTATLGDCAQKKDSEKPDCTCQIIDVNGRNAIAVPAP